MALWTTPNQGRSASAGTCSTHTSTPTTPTSTSPQPPAVQCPGSAGVMVPPQLLLPASGPGTLTRGWMTTTAATLTALSGPGATPPTLGGSANTVASASAVSPHQHHAQLDLRVLDATLTLLFCPSLWPHKQKNVHGLSMSPMAASGARVKATVAI